MSHRTSALLFVAGSALVSVSNAANLIDNPDFTLGLEGWSRSTDSGTVTIDDSTGLPGAPSIHLATDALTPSVAVESSCIPIDDSTNVDFRMNANAASGWITGSIAAFADAACSTALASIGTEAISANGAWGTYPLTDAALPDGTNSVKVILAASNGSLGSIADAHFDHIALGATGSIAEGIDINQEGLTGAWYNPATSGQGLLLTISPDTATPGAGSLFGAWYTYDTQAGGTDSQRWYSIDAFIARPSTSIDVTIYENVGGNFAALPVTQAVAVGTGVLMFDTCATGSFSYTFDDGRSGSVPLQSLLPNVECVETGAPTNPPSDFGYSGTWYDPATSGQGFLFTINPVDAQVFLGWYTYAIDGESSGAAGQRWFSAQAPYTLGSNSMDLTVYASTGGTFDSSATPVTTDAVGTATLTFTNCSSATLDYEFTSGELSGKSGSIALSRLGPVPASCHDSNE